MNDKPERTVRLRVENIRAESERQPFLDTTLGKTLLAFLFTTLLGTWLTTCYQIEQWTRQQDYTARVQRSEKRGTVAKGALQQMGEVFSQNNDLVHLITFGGDPRSDIAGVRDTQLKKALNDWFAKRQHWRVSEKVLTAETEGSFQYPATHCLLADVVRNREDLERDVEAFIIATNGRALSSFDEKTREKLIKDLETASSRIYLNVRATTGSGGLLSQLSDQMSQEGSDDLPQVRPLWRMRTDDNSGTPKLRGSPAVESAISQYLKALCSGNAALVPFTSDVRVTEQPAPALIGRPTPQRRAAPLRGVEAARQYIRDVASRIKSIRETRRIVHGNYARVLFDITLNSDDVLPSCECFRFDEGKIAEIKPYFDPRSAALTSLSSAPP